mgnify:CR=1 FL=1
MRTRALLDRLTDDEEEIPVKKRWKFMLALAAAALMVAGVAFAIAGGRVLELLKVDMVLGNRDYSAYLEGAVQALGVRASGGRAELTLVDAVYTDEALALTWTVEAKEEVWISDCEVFLDGRALDWDLDAPTINGARLPEVAASFNAREILLQSGESIDCGARFSPRQLPERAEIAVAITLVAGGGESTDTLRADASIQRTHVAVRSALRDGEPLEYAFPTHVLRITRADMTPKQIDIEVQYIFENEAAAEEFRVSHITAYTEDGPDTDWALYAQPNYDGGTQYETRALEDGRPMYLQQYSYRIGKQYDEITLVPGDRHEGMPIIPPGYADKPRWDEAITLKFK